MPTEDAVAIAVPRTPPPAPPPEQPPPPPQRISIKMTEFSLIRRTLRCFGFWQPEGAWLVERIVYPLIINLILLVLICIDMYGTICLWTKGKLDLPQKELFSFKLIPSQSFTSKQGMSKRTCLTWRCAKAWLMSTNVFSDGSVV